MRKPSLVPGAMFAPGCCMICGGNEGTMVDTGVDIPGDGRMYICTRICAPLIMDLLKEREPERLCSERRQDGNPCTGKALPGRDICVAHLRAQQKKEAEHELVASELR